MTAPSIMLHAWRKPRMAPVATNRSEPSSDIVYWFSERPLIEIHSVPQVERIFGYLSHGAHAGAVICVNGAHFGIHERSVTLSQLASASRIQVMTQPPSAARPSARACRSALPPVPWSERRV